MNISIYITILLFGLSPVKESSELQPYVSKPESLISSEEVFKILKAKCNVCHVKRNRRMTFTLKNMNQLSNKINNQVFVKQRMPKGNKIKLSNTEKSIIKNWINSINK